MHTSTIYNLNQLNHEDGKKTSLSFIYVLLVKWLENSWNSNLQKANAHGRVSLFRLLTLMKNIFLQKIEYHKSNIFPTLVFNVKSCFRNYDHSNCIKIITTVIYTQKQFVELVHVIEHAIKAFVFEKPWHVMNVFSCAFCNHLSCVIMIILRSVAAVLFVLFFANICSAIFLYSMI